MLIQNDIFRRVLLGFAVAAMTLSAAATALAQSISPGVYIIDPQQSEIHWRVYKAGAFARFGHNHVVAIDAPSGVIEVAGKLAESTVNIEFAAANLIIDEPQLRARYGEDFASEPTEEDVSGTKNNMLTDTVLNGDVYPMLVVTGTGLTGLGHSQKIDLSIAMLGRDVKVTVPVNVDVEGAAIHVTANFRLTHEDLGMEPFSVMMGALQVANEIDFTLDIRAETMPSVVF